VIAAAFYLGGHNRLTEVAGAVAAVVVAAFSYRFVEQPFRARREPARVARPANALATSR
jgi:peptidoglycan/LPS O-acetylase OafA/YrhL